MKICAIQQPYAHTPNKAEESVEFLIRELDSCDDSLDLILTPEYSNTPSKFPAGEYIAFAEKHTTRLENAARNAARRCNAIVALAYCAKSRYGWRNTTRIFDRSGEIAGDYYKQQLVVTEAAEHGVDDSYTRHFHAPEIVEVDGIRLGFVICYDAYFEEYIEHLGYRRPDIVLVSAFQRGEPCENLRLLNRMLAYHTGALVVRASVGSVCISVAGAAMSKTTSSPPDRASSARSRATSASSLPDRTTTLATSTATAPSRAQRMQTTKS